MKEGM